MGIKQCFPQGAQLHCAVLPGT